MFLFSVLNLGCALPKKKKFSAQRAHWIVADFRKKQLISRDEKLFSIYVFCLFFSLPSLIFFK